jgi:hypothetical protein
MATMRERQREVQLYRGQIPSPGRPTVAWRVDAQLAQIDQAAQLAELEEAFVKVAASWAKRSGISPAVRRRAYRPACSGGLDLSFRSSSCARLATRFD